MSSRAKSGKNASAETPTLPLSALLSQALVAFTIEFDNAAEHQLPHRTTDHGSTGGLRSPWLVSLAMYANCMQHIGPDGITIGALVRRARTVTKFRGMHRWGYITMRPAPESKLKKPDASWIVNATPGGRLAQEIWQPLFAVIENRWRARFGEDVIASLRESLQAIVGKLDPNLPDCLPILGYGLTSVPLKKKSITKKTNNKAALRDPDPPSTLPLSTLLSKALLDFAIEFENESDISLAICANVLRLVHEDSVSLRDLPIISGVSKESIAMALSFLKRQGYATVVSESGSRIKILRLTPKGRKAKAAYPTLISKIASRWEAEFGKAAIRELRDSLEQIAGDGTPRSPLFRGLVPSSENWRARVRKPEALPHFPMVLHRGGYPDGS
ncbi:MAG: MarR family winged helix-turn-helix transcriptional regulator [Terriglobales bacterium]